MKKEFTLAFRSLFKKGRNNIIKIVSLAVGLALGMVLIAKAYFEQTYDDFYPDADRICMIMSKFKQNAEPEQEYGQVSGAIAPGMKSDIPEVVAATRFTYITAPGATFYTADKKKYKGNFIMADEHFFEVLPRPMILGNAREVLSKPNMVLISEKIADNIGTGDRVIGQTIRLDNVPSVTLTIGGIFKDLPENANLDYNIIISLESISGFTWDGRENWVGNDRYLGYVKLAPGVAPESLAPAIRQMQERHQPMEEIKKAGLELNYKLIPLLDVHLSDPVARQMSLLLAILAFALLFTAVMNYVLIVISGLVGRSKEIAVYKCYGASEKNITALMLSETSVHLIIAIVAAVFLILLFQTTIGQLMKTSAAALFAPSSWALLLGVCVLAYLIAGLLPAWLFSRIPVAAAFRNFKESRRNWKLALLFVQFVATAFLLTLLVIIGKQYNLMINDNPGYQYENVLYCSTGGVPMEKKQQAIEELRRKIFVSEVATSDCLPFQGASGNNVSLPGTDEELFNYADLYRIDADYLSLMSIKIIKGQGFDRQTSTTEQAIVSRGYADKLAELAKWKDGVLGKTVFCSEHGNVNIIGIYADVRVGSLADVDKRPSMLFYNDKPSSNILIKLQEMTPENILEVTKIMEEAMPDKDINVIPYQTEMINLYSDSKLFRDTVMIGGIVTLLISLIGLIGYTNDEISRRQSEIAIRKINGATMADIQRLFNINILKIALPSIFFGCIGAYYIATKWQQQFAEKTPLAWWIFLASGIVVFFIIQAVVSLACYRKANQNPVENLKTN